jgi:PAS domain S-box-containing protein
MVNDSEKTREQLLDELDGLRRQADHVQKLLGGRMKADGEPGAEGDTEDADFELRRLLESTVSDAPLIVWAVDRDGVFLLSEGKMLDSLGLKPGEVVGQSAFDLYSDVPSIVESIRRALAGESFVSRVELGGMCLACWYSPLRMPREELPGAVGVAVDVTQNKRIEEQLESERQSLETLLRTHERDRRLTAYEIHDGLVQDATAAQMHLEALLKSGRLSDDFVRGEVETALDLTRKAVKEARHLIGGLRPPVLDELGVVAAIDYLIDDLPAREPWIDFVEDVHFDRLEPLLEGTLYRIIQEAVTNVVRHSKSHRAEVRLSQSADRIQVEIRDWGVGFDPLGRMGKRFGLQGIRERARLLHGRAVIESSPGVGTRVYVELPISGVPRKAAIINDRSIE